MGTAKTVRGWLWYLLVAGVASGILGGVFAGLLIVLVGLVGIQVNYWVLFLWTARIAAVVGFVVSIRIGLWINHVGRILEQREAAVRVRRLESIRWLPCSVMDCTSVIRDTLIPVLCRELNEETAQEIRQILAERVLVPHCEGAVLRGGREIVDELLFNNETITVVESANDAPPMVIVSIYRGPEATTAYEHLLARLAIKWDPADPVDTEAANTYFPLFKSWAKYFTWEKT